LVGIGMQKTITFMYVFVYKKGLISG